MSNEKRLGQDVRDFLSGFLNVTSEVTASRSEYMPLTRDQNSQMQESVYKVTAYNKERRDKTASGIGIEANQAARLKPGDLLIVYKQQCWQVDPKSGVITRLFELNREGNLSFWTAVPHVDGNIYCTASGFMSPSQPIRYAVFGNKGSVLRVNHRTREILSLASLVDPVGLEFLSDTQMLVADFNNWEGTGQVYIIDRITGDGRKIVDGGLITECYRAHLDSDGVLWVANASGLTYEGEIIRVDPDGKQEIVVPKRGPYSGVITTVFASNTPDKILSINVDWPYMASSSLFSVDKKTYEVETLLSTSTSHPGVYSPHIAIDNDLAWMVESYHNELLAYNLSSKEIVQTIDVSAITGSDIGIMHAWDFAESVTIVPEGFP
jgi:sugar lactone lactonase YvrE